MRCPLKHFPSRPEFCGLIPIDPSNHPTRNICVYPCPSVVLCSFSIRVHWCSFVVLYLPLPAPGGPCANLFCVPRAFVYTGGLRARRAHASERRICITVGASPEGRRTYGPETPTHPARRAALRNLNQQEDFRRRGRIRSSPPKNLRLSTVEKLRQKN